MPSHLDMLRSHQREQRQLAERDAWARFNAIHTAMLDRESVPDWSEVAREAGRLQRRAAKLAKGEV